jgi:7,8-dihydropterin-6-yl-methyl-4-(beta-D-ribofuranosyl)aminobenzene 5'-phosphate synthase
MYKYCPDIKLVIPKTWYPEGKELIKKSGHRGEVVELEAGKIHKIFPGCASAAFDVPIILRVQGEHGLFFNIRDKVGVIVKSDDHDSLFGVFLLVWM